jgi:hypothetical protein
VGGRGRRRAPSASFWRRGEPSVPVLLDGAQARRRGVAATATAAAATEAPLPAISGLVSTVRATAAPSAVGRDADGCGRLLRRRRLVGGRATSGRRQPRDRCRRLSLISCVGPSVWIDELLNRRWDVVGGRGRRRAPSASFWRRGEPSVPVLLDGAQARRRGVAATATAAAATEAPLPAIGSCSALISEVDFRELYYSQAGGYQQVWQAPGAPDWLGRLRRRRLIAGRDVGCGRCSNRARDSPNMTCETVSISCRCIQIAGIGW